MSDIQTGSASAGNPGAIAPVAEGAAIPPWYSTIEDADLRVYAENKGFKDPGAVLNSYRHLEKMQGVPADRLLKLPEANDDAGMLAVKQRLGFAPPSSAADYGLDKMEGFDPSFAKFAGDQFLQAGVPAEMATKTMTEIAGYLKKMEADHEANIATRHHSEMAQLDNEWGGKSVELKALAERSATEFKKTVGLEVADMDALIDALGPAKFNKLFAAIGSTTGEAKFVVGSGGDSGAVSPDAAAAKMDQLLNDKGWVSRHQSGDVAAVNEWNRLVTIKATAAANAGRKF
jgi:hypothetical protein